MFSSKLLAFYCFLTVCPYVGLYDRPQPTYLLRILPHRFIGGLYGRIIGVFLVDLYGGIPTESHWEWIDPGVWALIGAASFFGGVSRLTMSLAVIIVS